MWVRWVLVVLGTLFLLPSLSGCSSKSRTEPATPVNWEELEAQERAAEVQLARSVAASRSAQGQSQIVVTHARHMSDLGTLRGIVWERSFHLMRDAHLAAQNARSFEEAFALPAVQKYWQAAERLDELTAAESRAERLHTLRLLCTFKAGEGEGGEDDG